MHINVKAFLHGLEVRAYMYSMWLQGEGGGIMGLLWNEGIYVQSYQIASFRIPINWDSPGLQGC